MTSSFRIRNLGLAAVLAAAAALLVGIYVTSYRDSVESGAGLVSVLVAVRDIPEDTEGALLSGGDYLRREKVLQRSVVPGAISAPSEVARLVAAEPIHAGEQVTARQFRPLLQQGVLAKLSGNMRGLVVPGDAHQLLAGKLEDGNRIDVLANIKYKVKPTAGSGNERSRVASRVILRDLLVIQAPEDPGDGRATSGQNAYSVLLAVSDSQMQKLFFAMKNGDWSLALRPVATPTDGPESVETIESVLGDGLRFKQLQQLTSGYGKGSISNGQ